MVHQPNIQLLAEPRNRLEKILENLKSEVLTYLGGYHTFCDIKCALNLQITLLGQKSVIYAPQFSGGKSWKNLSSLSRLVAMICKNNQKTCGS